MYGNLLRPEINHLIASRDFNTLREVFSEWPPPDLGQLISEIPEYDQAIVFRLLPRELAARTFEYLQLETQKTLIKAMGQKEVATVLNDMSPDDRTALLEELPADVTKQLLELLTPEERKMAVTLLGYPENTIGRLMTPDYIAVQEEWKVSQVLDYIRENGRDRETLEMIFVTDPQGKLIDDIRIREFLLAPLDTEVKELMNYNFVSLRAWDDQETAVKIFKEHDRVALPVTDNAGQLIGIVTVDDVMDVAEEEATEDIHKLGGVEALDEPYLNVSLKSMIRKRASWLVVLFLGEMLTASAMGFFEEEIARAVVLALFVPLIISSGGNSGSQAASLIIRAMAVGDVGLREWWKVLKREAIVGAMLGLILAAVGFLRISVWSAFSDIYGPHWLLIAMTVSCALVGVVLWGILIGSMLPFLLKRLGADPATSSAPFVATLVDVTGLVIYFSVGYMILHGTLL